MITDQEMKKIVRFCQKNGIIKFKSGDFEIEIKEKIVYPKEKEPVASTSPGLPSDFPSWDSLTPEQRLFWSSTPPDVPMPSNS